MAACGDARDSVTTDHSRPRAISQKLAARKPDITAFAEINPDGGPPRQSEVMRRGPSPTCDSATLGDGGRKEDSPATATGEQHLRASENYQARNAAPVMAVKEYGRLVTRMAAKGTFSSASAP